MSVWARAQRALSLPKGGAIRVPFDTSRPTDEALSAACIHRLGVPWCDQSSCNQGVVAWAINFPFLMIFCK